MNDIKLASVRLTHSLETEIEKLGKSENRNLTNMTQTLLHEALEHRGILDRTYTKKKAGRK